MNITNEEYEIVCNLHAKIWQGKIFTDILESERVTICEALMDIMELAEAE